MELEIAHVEMLFRREGESKGKPAEVCDFGHLSAPVNAVNLAKLPATPQNTVAVEGESFRMVQPIDEDLKVCDA
jgi:hypothetical protein